ncbi:zinc ribbon domain-containing protein, partial [Fulvimarina sp. MAC8]|uniref:zinc ribbon domain-containing protein n=1 Tax=Fulvimarina sp. MAC8 TaxID=3162874 RepID=UPI0032EB485B
IALFGELRQPIRNVPKSKLTRHPILPTTTTSVNQITAKNSNFRRRPAVPLRVHVVCADCENPLTACWSKVSHGRYPYYHCPKHGCESYVKSLRRADIEGEFEARLKTPQPIDALFCVARAMFKDL